MGKFNFMSGGYYGKLGQTVGQRFRNQRVVHAYVVPSNPRTETQQENRLRFVDITGATQLANQLNGGSRLWDSLTNTNFNNRMAEASKYAEQGGALYTYVPLIPYGYEPEHHFEPSPTYENHVLTWTCTDTAHLLGRQMAVALRLQRISNSRYENVILRAVVGGAAGAWTFSVTLPDTHRINSDSWQIGINCDDGEEQLEMVYLAPMNIANLKEKITLTLNSLSVTWDSINETYSGTISTSPAIAADAMPLLSASLSGILQAEASAQNTIIQTVNSAGALAFTFTPNRDSLNQRVLFPAGSTCTIPAATFQSDTYIYQVPATTLTFSAALETQTLANAFTSNITTEGVTLTFLPPEGSTNWTRGTGYAYVLEDNNETETSIMQKNMLWYVTQNETFQAILDNSLSQFLLGKNGAGFFYFSQAPSCVLRGITYQLTKIGANYAGVIGWASSQHTLFTAYDREGDYITSTANLAETIQTDIALNFQFNATNATIGILTFNNGNNQADGYYNSKWKTDTITVQDGHTIFIESVILDTAWMDYVQTLYSWYMENLTMQATIQIPDGAGGYAVNCTVTFDCLTSYA